MYLSLNQMLKYYILIKNKKSEGNYIEINKLVNAWDILSIQNEYSFNQII